jgi:hypothetical protein
VPLLPHLHTPTPVNNAPNVADTELKYTSLDITLTSSLFGTLAGVLPTQAEKNILRYTHMTPTRKTPSAFYTFQHQMFCARSSHPKTVSVLLVIRKQTKQTEKRARAR